MIFGIKQNKKTKTFTVPGSWQELTFGQVVQIVAEQTRDGFNELSLLSILTGVDRETLGGSKNHKQFSTMMSVVAQWYNDMPELSKGKPERIEIDGLFYDVPKGFDECVTISQRMEIERIFRESINEKLEVEVMPDVLAVIFQPIIDESPFDTDELEKTKDKLLGANGIDLTRIGSFFLRESVKALQRGRKDLVADTTETKRTRGLRSFLSSATSRR